MTRFLRLLLIAAVAWPLCHPAAAQEPAEMLAPAFVKEKIASSKAHVHDDVASKHDNFQESKNQYCPK